MTLFFEQLSVVACMRIKKRSADYIFSSGDDKDEKVFKKQKICHHIADLHHHNHSYASNSFLNCTDAHVAPSQMTYMCPFNAKCSVQSQLNVQIKHNIKES